MLHTGKISKCLDVDAKQRQCGTLSQCSRVTKFETVLWVSTKGFSVLCGHLGLPGHFFSWNVCCGFHGCSTSWPGKINNLIHPDLATRPYRNHMVENLQYIYIGKDRMVTERNIWGVEWSCSCVIVGFICIELHQIMQINCVYKHFLSMADVDISHFQKGV